MNKWIKGSLVALLVLGIALTGATSTKAMSGTVEITGFAYTGNVTPTPTVCDQMDVTLKMMLTGTINDLGGYDYYGLVMFDGNSHPLFAIGNNTIFVGTTVTNDAWRVLISSIDQRQISTRNVTVELYDITAPPADVSYATNTLNLFGFIREGALLDKAEGDIGVIQQCAILPVVTI